MEPSLEGLPEILAPRVAVALERCGALDLPDELVEQLPRVWAASSFVSDWCVKCTAEFQELAAAGELSRDREATELTQAMGRLDPADFDGALRRLRNREMARIAWREIVGEVSPERTVIELSELADASIRAVWDWHWAQLVQRHGQPRDRDGGLIPGLVLALGKLGGRELNFSSDVDLMFVHLADGETDGDKVIDAGRFFSRLAQLFSATLSERQADGFVFRVDLRLRPYGSSGPMSVSLPAMEDYYSAHGREWERYALIKARVIVGDPAPAQELMGVIRPFVYRRYLDYGAIESMREMKSQIDAQVRKQGHEEHIKLGWGGIREVEFLVQVFQLISGGAEPTLQTASLMRAMDALLRLQMLPAADLEILRRAYWFLRRLENCWQAQSDQQSHVLPSREEPRQALAVALGHQSWQQLTAELQAQRVAVHARFSRLFAEPAEVDESTHKALKAWWLGDESALELDAPGQLALEAVRESAQRRMDDSGDIEELQELITALIAPARERGVLVAVLSIIEQLAGRSNYVALLRENPVARNELIYLCARSSWLTGELRRHPSLLGELVDTESLYAPDERATFRARLQDNLKALPDDDDEVRLDTLRHARHAAMLRIAAADVSAALPIMRVSDRLSELAEEVLDAALDLAVGQMRRRYPDLKELEFAVIAYGKLGGLELSYTSDLDLVFIYQPGSDLPLDAQVFYTRLAQKFIHCLATPTGAGVAYEVDTRLRPSGASGLLVTSFDGMIAYQKEQAWTWEHQALIRARPVIGSAVIAQRFNELRVQTLAAPREREALYRDVREMREKMRAELAPRDGRLDLKQSPGGIADIEFFVQFMILANAADHPQILRYTDVCRLLEQLADAGCLTAADAEFLAESWRRLRTASHREFLCGERPAGSAEIIDTMQAISGRLAVLFRP